MLTFLKVEESPCAPNTNLLETSAAMISARFLVQEGGKEGKGKKTVRERERQRQRERKGEREERGRKCQPFSLLPSFLSACPSAACLPPEGT